MSAGPDVLASLKRFSIKEPSIQPRLDEETVATSEAPGRRAEVKTSLPLLSDSSIPVHSTPSSASAGTTDTVQGPTAATNGPDESDMTSIHTEDGPTFAVGLPGRVMGRNFDDDSDDDIHIGEELAQLSGLFERAPQVLNNPVRCGIFLNYLFTQNRDPIPALFYLVANYFQYVLRSCKDMLKEQRRLSIEIFSTFLHEKSPLRLDIPTPVVHETYEMIQAGAGSMTFKSAAEAALSVVQAQVSKLAQEIRHGMVTWKPPEPVNLFVRRTREEQLVVFELCLTGRLQSLWQKATESAVSGTGPGDAATGTMADGTLTQDQTALALCLALVTTYRCLSVIDVSGPKGTGAQDSFDTMDSSTAAAANAGTGVGYSIRNSLFARSYENLTGSVLGSSAGVGSSTGSISGGLSAAGSNLWMKIGHFGAKMKQKPHSGHLFGSRKAKHSQKNHILQARAFERVVDCWVCGKLLWGLAPQGLACNNCNLSVHTKCKSNIRETCTKEGRKSAIVSSPYYNNGCVLTPTITSTLTETTSPLASSAQIIRVQSTLVPPATTELLATPSTANRPNVISSSGGVGAGGEVISEAVPRGSLDSVSLASLPLPAGTSIAESSPITRPPTGSMSGLTDISDGGTERLRNRSVGDEHISSDGTADPRYVGQMRKRFENSDPGNESGTPPSRSDSLASTSSVPLGYVTALDRSGEPTTPNPGSMANDLVPELVTTDWSDDPEMMAGESFEAAVELQRHFPAYQMPTKGHKSEDYIRTLCLLEFHQKTQYMVRHLKQYEYLLLRRWPPEHERLAHVLCLDRIPELIRLFRSLVECIDKTKTPQGYLGMAEAVYAWLTDNSCANLKTWAQHCQALSCSNMLDCVRIMVRDYVRRNPDILPLLKTRHNKFVLIEGLKQMRILYFNLPLISNNIVKDLEKKTKSYKAEAKIWQQIHAKLVSLPQTIDDVCMPLVKRINSGQLYSNFYKKDAIFRQNQSTIEPFQNLLVNFPRVLFHYWVVAHAEVTVDKLTVTSANKVNHDYIRERTDMLAIMLHNALMFLVKDNDRYVLRAFKVAREHGSGGGSAAPAPVPVASIATAGSATDTFRSATGASTGSVGTTERGSFHLSSSSFSHGSNPAASSPNPSTVGSLSASTGSALYGSLFSGSTGTGATTAAGGCAGTASGAQSGSGFVGAAASLASAAGLADKPSGSGSLKLAPIFPLRNMFPSCGEKFGGDHLLNIVSMDPTVLVRVLFSKEEQRQHWYSLLRENIVITANRVASLQQQQQRGQRLAQGTGNGTSKPGTTTVALTSSSGLSSTTPALSKPTTISLQSGHQMHTPTDRETSDTHSTVNGSPKSREPLDSGLFTSPSSIDTSPGGAHHHRRSGAKARAIGLDTSDSAGSTEELASPVDRLHLTINRLNRLIEQIRPALVETGCSEQQQNEQRQPEDKADEVGTGEAKAHNFDDLVMLQFDLLREWLGYLSPIVARTCLRRLGGSSLIAALDTDREDEEPENEPATSSFSSLSRQNRLDRSGDSFIKKRQSSLSWPEGCINLELSSGGGDGDGVSGGVTAGTGAKSVTPPPTSSTTEGTTSISSVREDRNCATLTSSTPNLLQLEHPILSGHVRPGAPVKVQDFRRFKHTRPARSASISQTTSHHYLSQEQQGQAESERVLADRIELLASKLVQAVQQYKRLNTSEPARQDPDRSSELQRSSTLQPSTVDNTVPLGYFSDDDRRSSRLLTPLDMELATPSDFGASFDGGAGTDDSDDHEDAFLRDETVERSDTLRASETPVAQTQLVCSPTSVDAPSEPPKDYCETNTSPDSCSMNQEGAPMEQTEPDSSSSDSLSGSAGAGIRDSGCVPSVTDEDEDDEETLGDPVDSHRRSSTPVLDTEADLTPTAFATMTDQLFDQLNDPVEPLESASITAESFPNELTVAPEQPDPPQISVHKPDCAPTEHLDTPVGPTTLVGRTDSQKSTTSSGFVESGDD